MIGSIASLVCVLSCGSMTPLAFTAQMQSVVTALNHQSDVAAGVISSVDAELKTFSLKTSEDRSVTIRVNDETVYYLDGERSTMSEALRAGRNATVTHEDRTATKVEVKTASS